VHPVLIDLGRFQLPTYGVLLVIAVGLGLWTLHRRASAAGLDADRILDLGLWVIVWALVGSKLALVLVEAPRYLHHPAELLGVIRAGGVFLGGLLAAILAGAVLIRRYGLPFLPVADAAAPSVSLGQAIGRIGCLMAGCCWGGRCDLPWAITYTDPRFNFTLYLLLAWLYRRRPPTGRVFAAYLLLYGMGRFLLEYTRGDAERGFVLGGLLSTSQAISIGLVAAGAILLLRTLRGARRA